MNEVYEWLTDERGLAELRDPWSRLPRMLGSPFLRHEWFAAWWPAFGEGELRILTLRRDDELAGVLPLARRGNALTSLANRHSQLYSALGSDVDARIALARRAVRAAPELCLEGLGGQDELLTALAQEARATGRLSFAEPLRRSPFVSTTGDFDSYVHDRLSPDTRRSLARSRRRLERDLAPEIRVVEPFDAVDDQLDELFALESAGWKGRDGTAVLSSTSTTEFFRGLSRALAAAGILRLSTIRVAGEVIAFELSVLDGTRLWSLKTSYDERRGRYSPGRLLRLAVIERCFELELETNEMLGADEAYKLSFATSVRPSVTFRSYARAALPLARFAYRRHVRPAVKQVYLNYGGLHARMAVQRAVVRRGA